jgi:YVTN family beta-propeller protein
LNYPVNRASNVFIATVFVWLVFSLSSTRAQESAAIPRDVLLPNGRMIAPAGTWIPLAPFPFALAVRPDGMQVVAPSIGWPFALNIVTAPDSASPSIQRIPKTQDSDPEIRVHMGIAYSPDGSLLYDPTGDSGAVDVYASSDWHRLVRIPLDFAAGPKESFAAAVVLSPDGKILYALDQGNWRVAMIDLTSRNVIASVPTGSNPLAIALSPDGDRLYVTNSGLFEYQLVRALKPIDSSHTGLTFPPFGYPSETAREGTHVEGHDVPGLGDENSLNGSSLWTYDVSTPSAPRVIGRLRLGDQITEGRNGVVGGAAPSGIAVGADHIYVSLAHQDSVAVVSPDSSKLEAEIPLSPFSGESYRDRNGRALRGVMPFGMTYADQRLYVAEAGTNSVAVIDTDSNRLITHIPVGWYPAAVAVSPDKHTLFVVNNKGKGSGPNVGRDLTRDSRRYIGELEFGSISVISLPIDEKNTAALAAEVIRTNEAAVAQSQTLPHLRHIFLIIRENRTYDEIFGDVANANGEPKLARYGLHGWVEEDPSKRDLAVTPNAHALVERFGSSDNFYVNSDVSADGHRWALGIAPAPWMNIAWTSSYGGRRTESADSKAPGRRALGGGADAPMPEDEPEFGSLWEHVANAGLPIVNYGEGLEVEGNDERAATEPEGQRLYLNSPVPQPVFVSTDRKFPTFNLGIPDQYRYAEFLRDFTRRNKSGYDAALTVIRLPNDHTATPRSGDGYPYRASFVADNDLALGKIVDTISHSVVWKDTAIFVIEDDAQSGVDHVDAHRSPVLVISPYARRGYISHRHTSMASVQKTIYELLGLGPLNLEDALSADMSDMFTDAPDFAPFTFVRSDIRVFDPARARLAHPKTAVERSELLDMDDPNEISRQFHPKPHSPDKEHDRD